MNNTYLSEPVLVVLDGLVGGAVNDEPCRLLAPIVLENLALENLRESPPLPRQWILGVSVPTGPCRLGCKPTSTFNLSIF